jgi:2-oxo-4-hydroxy-4-carboxy-5-ureidoimidazoline decarboxylase
MTDAPITLDDLNDASRTRFVDALGAVFEDAEWVAERAWEVKPFPTVAALHQALFDEVLDADEALQLEFLNGHPDLAGAAAQQRAMGEHSTQEQAALGLDRLDEAGFARFEAMNLDYRARFGFPFLICVRRHTRASILRQFARRLGATPQAELQAALQEVFYITRLRLAGLVRGPGAPVVTGGLSTHVLDTAHGRPGAGVLVELFEIGDDGAELVASSETNADGRVPGGLIPDGVAPLRIGTYELRFHVGPYFARAGAALADPPYFDVVPVRVSLAEAEAHYHIPLLVTPWTYTTYRGS